jgi:hypothetical protein
MISRCSVSGQHGEAGACGVVGCLSLPVSWTWGLNLSLSLVVEYVIVFHEINGLAGVI